jgi:hypothetical protein
MHLYTNRPKSSGGKKVCAVVIENFRLSLGVFRKPMLTNAT